MPQSTSAAANQIGAEPVAFLYVALLYGGRECICPIMADGLDAGHSTTKERAYVLMGLMPGTAQPRKRLMFWHSSLWLGWPLWGWG